MGQDDLVRLLKTKKKWLGAMEISKELKIGIRSTRLKLEKLRNKKEIKNGEKINETPKSK